MRFLFFPEHKELDGMHAPFPASQPSWLNYDDDKVVLKYRNDTRKELGTELHDFAASSIRFSDKLKKNKNDIVRSFKSYLRGKYDKTGSSDISDDEKKKLFRKLVRLYQSIDYLTDTTWLTLMMYINDTIGFRMTPERHLFYSWNFYGTCDAISYDILNNYLRIHDLKTGDIPGKIEQLYVYSALVVLEHRLKPEDIKGELRIYQNAQIYSEDLNVSKLNVVLDKIKRFDDIWNEQNVFEGAE